MQYGLGLTWVLYSQISVSSIEKIMGVRFYARTLWRTTCHAIQIPLLKYRHWSPSCWGCCRSSSVLSVFGDSVTPPTVAGHIAGLINTEYGDQTHLWRTCYLQNFLWCCWGCGGVAQHLIDSRNSLNQHLSQCAAWATQDLNSIIACPQ